MRRGVMKWTAWLLAVIMLAGCAGQGSNTGNTGTEGDGAATGVIAWAEGGGTDSLMRPLIDEVNAQGEMSLNAVNRTGMAGAMAMQYVYEQEPDGDTLLMSAENPALYQVLGYGDLNYDNFECVMLIGSETVGVVVRADSEWQTFTDLVEAAKSGREVLEATTNVGGMPWTLTAMTQGVTGAKFTQVWYDGDKSAMEAVADGDVDFTFCKLQIGEQAAQEGKIRYLALMADEEVSGWESVPLVTAEYPGFAEYLPWGPFYGVFVKEGTPEETITAWKDAFASAFASESYQQMLKDAYIEPSGKSGEEAAAYIHDWQEKTVNILSGLDLDQHFKFQEAE